MESDIGRAEQYAGRARDAQPSDEPLSPLPPAGPQAPGQQRPPQTAIEIADDALDDDEDPHPTVEHQAWLKKDDYWRRTTFIAVTGRHTATPPRTRPLPPPRRFGRPTPVRSTLILALMLLLIILIPFGVIAAQRAAARIRLPTVIPGVTLPTPTRTLHPTATVKPTATPKKKK